MCRTSSNNKFHNLGSPQRVWAVSAIHGDLDRLTSLHDAIFERFNVGDKIVYLGNYTGYGERSAQCVEEILTFRRLLLSISGMRCSDISYLRGAQEEMWQKLFQLQFAPDPMNILLWMLGNGLSNTLYSYGLDPHDGIEACRSGITGLGKWTAKVREAVRKHPGHDAFGTHLSRAAHTAETQDYPMLFVNSGIDIRRPLDDQGDRLWWYGDNFTKIDEPYKPFEKVVRGYDPKHNGIHLNCVTATIDGGCGFGGNLVGAGFEANGQVFELLEA